MSVTHCNFHFSCCGEHRKIHFSKKEIRPACPSRVSAAGIDTQNIENQYPEFSWPISLGSTRWKEAHFFVE